MPSGAMPACVHCGKPAVVALDYANIDLCGLCFTCLFERRVWKANREFKLFKRGDRVVVGVSGGKDSSAMLFVLSKMAGQIGFEILPVLVDEGIEGYRNKAIPLAEQLCERLGLQLKIHSYKQAVGKSMDEIVQLRDAGKIRGKSCSFCGVLRRRALDNAAVELKATKIAVGHNADDVAQTFLMNLLRGEPQRNERFGVTSMHEQSTDFGGVVPRIRPLVFNTEKEAAEYCLVNDLPFYLGDCPYAVEAFRGEVKDFLNNVEEKYPGTKFNLLHSFLKEKGGQASPAKEKAVVLKCAKCNSPASGELCKACEIAELLKA